MAFGIVNKRLKIGAAWYAVGFQNENRQTISGEYLGDALADDKRQVMRLG